MVYLDRGLQYQQRRHKKEVKLVYAQIGKQMPPSKPCLSVLESWFNIMLGLVLLSVMTFMMIMMVQEKSIIQNIIIPLVMGYAVALWAMAMGTKSLLYHRKIKKNIVAKVQ
jgi:hypothetical protein